MFSHMMVGSNDLERSKRFYDAAVRQGSQARRQGPAQLTAAARRGVHGHRRRSMASRRHVATARPSASTSTRPRRSTPGMRRVSRRAAPRSRTRRAGARGIRQALSRVSARSRRQQAVRPAPAGAMSVEIVSENKAHGGRQLVVKHPSAATRTDMIFSIFLPPQAESGRKLPVVWYLSGLTCTHANVTEKGEYRAACAEHGLIFVAPDTSPRGPEVPTTPKACGISARARASMSMRPRSLGRQISTCGPTSPRSCRRWSRPNSRSTWAAGIMGHSMGGHGALTLALGLPDRFRSVSAFSPIVAPSQVPWGQKALAVISARIARPGASTTRSR